MVPSRKRYMDVQWRILGAAIGIVIYKYTRYLLINYVTRSFHVQPGGYGMLIVGHANLVV